MSINVYWTAVAGSGSMLATPPESVMSTFLKKKFIDPDNPLSHIHHCPAFNDNFRNVFTMKSLYNYEFFLENGTLTSKDYDQEFYDNHVVIRSYEKRFFTFMNSYLFFTDEPSLNATFYEYPCFEDNNITQRCIPIAGQFDIGKWFRNTEFVFFLKHSHQSFKIEQNEVYSYMRFHTHKKINFIEFNYSDKLKKFNQQRAEAITKVSRLSKLENYYKMFRHKKLILKEIKENVIA
jgi:hypothetical protein